MFFNRAKKLNYEVIVLYRYDKSNNVSKTDFYEFMAYLEDTYQLKFEFMTFDTLDFASDHLYSTIKGKKEIEKIGWDKIVSVSLYEGDIRKMDVSYSFKFSATNNPSMIRLLIPKVLEFDIKEFLLRFQSIFKPDYGFNYFTDQNEWNTAYTLINYFKLSRMDGVSRLSDKLKEEFWAHHGEVVNGLFRDVYYINVLNSRHINRKFDGISLVEKITVDKLGHLELIYEDVYLWLLSKDELGVARSLVF